jgi:hypothetical protein
MTTEELARLLELAGCPPAKCAELAAQMEKRAQQLAEQTGRNHDEALAHLLNLLKQGWAAQERARSASS